MQRQEIYHRQIQTCMQQLPLPHLKALREVSLALSNV